VPVELVLNKIDLVDSLRRRRLANRYPGSLLVSAATGEGLEELRRRLATQFEERFEAVEMLLPYDEGARLAELYAQGAPIQERVDRPEGVFVRAHLPRRDLPRYARFIVAGSRKTAEAPARSAK
jgi:GTPase